MRRVQYRYGVLALVVIIAIEAAVLSFPYDAPLEYGTAVEAHTEAVFEKCKNESYRPFCYEQEIPKLLDALTLTEVFGVIRSIRIKDTSYRFCHVLAHELGVREVAKDPENWIDVIARGPSDGLCSNGFIHGAAVARFSKEVLSDEEIKEAVPELQIACEPRESFDPTGLDQAICYHGIGHVLMHLTEADINKSLEICEEVAFKSDGRDFRQVCNEGVFMQIFQPLEPEDFALVDKLELKPTKENLAYFCGHYGDTAEQAACWREGWPFYKSELNTAEGIISFCANSIDDQQKENCYNTVLSIKGRGALNNPQEMARLCNTLPSDLQLICFMRGSSAYIEEDKSFIEEGVLFCGNAEAQEVKNNCYDYLINVANFNFHPESPETQVLCRALPQPWKDHCIDNVL